MTKQSPPEQIQNPLTLVMTAKSSESYAILQHLIQEIQALPPEENQFMVALNNLANVHFARFAFLGNNQVAVITTYDGDFDAYINGFINEVGEIFNKILAHIKDCPPLPVQTYRQEFHEFVRAHDLGCVGPFYTAYPNHTVLDILDMVGSS